MCQNRHTKYENIKDRRDTDFKRLTGVEQATFRQMVQVLEAERSSFGRPPSLSRANQLLMPLMYRREYRTQLQAKSRFMQEVY